MRRRWPAAALVTMWLLAEPARAQDVETQAEAQAEAPTDADAVSASLSATTSSDSLVISAPIDGHLLTLAIGGYVETHFTWSFNEPGGASNGVIAWRGFDNRHSTFTLANVALSTRFDYDRVYAAITLQWGNTPDTYYLAEPSAPALAGVGASSAATWRFLQQAYLGWNVPLLEGIRVEGELFLSPIGFESMAIRSDWQWSRSNLFYGLPFYHAGIRLSTELADHLVLSAGVFNGWNAVLDGNPEKSVAAWLDYTTDELSLHVLYFGGVERVDGNWRNLFDAWISVAPTEWLELALHGDAGFEPISLPTGQPLAWWAAGALYARVTPLEWLAIAVRADVFYDHAPNDDPSLRTFWPVPWMASQTLTVQLTPERHITFFVEYRHDHAAEQANPDATAPPIRAFFAGNVVTDPTGNPIRNAVTQDTLTLGATAGF